MKKYVLDACSLIAYFNQENGSEKVEEILSEENDIFISIVNVFEICYDLDRTSEDISGLDIYNDIKELPLTIIETIDKEQIEHAIFFKNQFKISVADSFALSLARKVNAILVTSDHHEFDEIEKEGLLNFLWIR